MLTQEKNSKERFFKIEVTLGDLNINKRIFNIFALVYMYDVVHFNGDRTTILFVDLLQKNKHLS